MDNITNVTSDALKNYFNTLSKLGYKNYNDVSKLIVLLFIEELLTSELSSYVTENDYRSIINASYCIMSNNCLINFPSYTTWDSLFHNDPNYLQYIRYRTTEGSVIRITEDSRIKAEA